MSFNSTPDRAGCHGHPASRHLRLLHNASTLGVSLKSMTNLLGKISPAFLRGGKVAPQGRMRADVPVFPGKRVAAAVVLRAMQCSPLHALPRCPPSQPKNFPPKPPARAITPGRGSVLSSVFPHSWLRSHPRRCRRHWAKITCPDHHRAATSTAFNARMISKILPFGISPRVLQLTAANAPPVTRTVVVTMRVGAVTSLRA